MDARATTGVMCPSRYQRLIPLSRCDILILRFGRAKVVNVVVRIRRTARPVAAQYGGVDDFGCRHCLPTAAFAPVGGPAASSYTVAVVNTFIHNGCYRVNYESGSARSGLSSESASLFVSDSSASARYFRLRFFCADNAFFFFISFFIADLD